MRLWGSDDPIERKLHWHALQWKAREKEIHTDYPGCGQIRTNTDGVLFVRDDHYSYEALGMHTIIEDKKYLICGFDFDGEVLSHFKRTVLSIFGLYCGTRYPIIRFGNISINSAHFNNRLLTYGCITRKPIYGIDVNYYYMIGRSDIFSYERGFYAFGGSSYLQAYRRFLHNQWIEKIE